MVGQTNTCMIKIGLIVMKKESMFGKKANGVQEV
jgi:hypothetical protein